MDFNIAGSVIYHNRLYTNAELKNIYSRIQQSLEGIESGTRVALAMNRTPLMLVTLFVLLKKGIPFMPIDLTFPDERLKYMFDKAEINTVISDSKETICGKDTILINYDENQKKHIEKYSEDEENTVSNDEVAYVLFTSGTTGKPKAVEVLRGGLENFIEGIMEKVKFTDNVVMLCLTNFTFDIFFLESVLALQEGMIVVLADEIERNNPRLIKNLIEINNVNTMQCTPSTMKMLEMIDPELEMLHGIETIMLGGEPLPESMLIALQKAITGRIYNMYGPTETTIWSTVSELTLEKEVDIGFPIKNTEILIVDEKMIILPDGNEGEILITGSGLAKGYLNDSELTDKAFVYIEHNRKKMRAYKTGDFGYRKENGKYICLGRKDGQVKVLGHRIELGDVEYHISRIPEVTNDVVIFNQNDSILVCLYLSDKIVDENTLRKKAALYLPDYMIPTKWIRVDNLMYTPSGKIDRKSMTELYKEHFDLTYTENEIDSLEGKNEDTELMKIISCFGISDKELSEETILLSLGLDSLKYVSCLVKIEDMFDIEFEDEMLSPDYFNTIGELVDYIKSIK